MRARLIALGVPRNPEIQANGDPQFYDLGLCGPVRKDLRHNEEYCGRFMTPSLRNVAVRDVFFHNGAIRSLKEAIAFYVEKLGFKLVEDTNQGGGKRWVVVTPPGGDAGRAEERHVG